VLDLGFSALGAMDLLEIAAPHLRKLSDDTHCTVNLAILEGTDVVYVERYRSSRPGQQEIDLNLHVGARLPAYCTAMGKAILAFLPEDRVAQLIQRIDFEQRGPNTITEPGAFRAALARVRESGLAVNDEELAYGLRSIAAPILSHTGEPIAAVNLAVHRAMASMGELLAHYGPPVTEAAGAISESLGYRP